MAFPALHAVLWQLAASHTSAVSPQWIAPLPAQSGPRQTWSQGREVRARTSTGVIGMPLSATAGRADFGKFLGVMARRPRLTEAGGESSRTRQRQPRIGARSRLVRGLGGGSAVAHWTLGALGIISMLGIRHHRLSANRAGVHKTRRYFFGGQTEASALGSTKVGLFFDERMTKHVNLEEVRGSIMSTMHPESPLRVLSAFESLEKEGLAQRCTRIPCRKATRDELELKHTAEHVDAMLKLQDLSEADAMEMSKQYEDIYLCPGSTEAGLLAAGSVVEATARVCKGEVENALCIVRPPGHHAEIDCAKGFCMFGNVALAAAEARRQNWSQRTLIVDFDVHHGNGTQNMFDDDKTVLFMSLHRFDGGKFYPSGNLGNYTSHGVGSGVGCSVNIPWDVEGGEKRGYEPPGDLEFLYAFDRVLLPIAEEFDPDLVLVSAGFDAAEFDPLGGCKVTPEGFYEIIKRLLKLSQGKLVVALEGGYELEGIKLNTVACARALLGDPLPPKSSPGIFDMVLGTDKVSTKSAPSVFHTQTVEEVRRHLAKMWSSLKRPST